MGRKPIKHGKDKTRTIALDGDVAGIAQRLASKSQLSATLSELLRREYGLTSEIDDKKAMLAAMVEEDRARAAAREALAAEIDQMEQAAIERAATEVPALQRRLAILHERHDRVEKEMMRAFTPHEVGVKERVLRNIKQLIEATENEIKELSN